MHQGGAGYRYPITLTTPSLGSTPGIIRATLDTHVFINLTNGRGSRSVEAVKREKTLCEVQQASYQLSVYLSEELVEHGVGQRESNLCVSRHVVKRDDTLVLVVHVGDMPVWREKAECDGLH